MGRAEPGRVLAARYRLRAVIRRDEAGAVWLAMDGAGHTDVANRDQNALTRMQNVRYYVAFRVLKAAESVFGAVTCCPGCFSAYRRECVLPILDRNQFMRE